jgi:hypothetical protein
MPLVSVIAFIVEVIQANSREVDLAHQLVGREWGAWVHASGTTTTDGNNFARIVPPAMVSLTKGVDFCSKP